MLICGYTNSFKYIPVKTIKEYPIYEYFEALHIWWEDGYLYFSLPVYGKFRSPMSEKEYYNATKDSVATRVVMCGLIEDGDYHE